jgi:hypothetical protein
MGLRSAIAAAAALAAATAPPALGDAARLVPEGSPRARLVVGVSTTAPVSDGRRSIVVSRGDPYDPAVLVVVDTATGRRRRVTAPHHCVPSTGAAGQVAVACRSGVYLLSTRSGRLRRLGLAPGCDEVPIAMGAHWLLVRPASGACGGRNVAVRWRTGARAAVEPGTAPDLDARAYVATPLRGVEFTRNGRYFHHRLRGYSLDLVLAGNGAETVLGPCRDVTCEDEQLVANTATWVDGTEVAGAHGYALDGRRSRRYLVHPAAHDAGGINGAEAIRVTATTEALVLATIRRYDFDIGPDSPFFPLSWRVWLAPLPTAPARSPGAVSRSSPRRSG